MAKAKGQGTLGLPPSSMRPPSPSFPRLLEHNVHKKCLWGDFSPMRCTRSPSLPD